MEQKKISLSTIKPNKANPRVIKDSKFHKLVNSILVFPKMMEARPIVVNNEMVVLGGNMRLKALEVIKTMNEAEIRSRLGNLTDFTLKPKKEQEALVSEWLKWQDKPETFVVNAKEFTDAEQKQFIVKDNASFGEWDFDALKELYSTDFLSEMSIDIPAIQSDINMDDFFYDCENKDSFKKTNNETITITIPSNEKDNIPTIKKLLTHILSKNYPTLSIR